MSIQISTIQCPNCGTAIDVNDLLKHQIEDTLRKEFQYKAAMQEKELAIKKANLR